MLKGLLIACCVSLTLCQLPKASAQYVRVGVDGPIPLGKLDAMESMLDLADAHQKADLLARLGVDPLVAKAAAEALLPGQKIQLFPIRTTSGAHSGIAFLPNGTGISCYLYLLQGSDEHPDTKPWHAVDHQDINCWDGPASLETMPLRRPDEDDLVLHHVNENHGSGVVADQTQIFSILGGKLVQTLATEDFLTEVTLGTTDTLDRRSTFLRFPNNSLEETRTTALNDKLKKVERRSWRWSEQKRTFVSTPFLPVVAPRQ
jgi:hypothetical protein